MSLQPRPPVKLSDVAAAAGVAPMTVSRVLNSPERVSAATAQLVRAAIERLGYVPNLVAGGLSSRRTRMVAAIVPTMAHPMFAELVQNFTDALRARGYGADIGTHADLNHTSLMLAVDPSMVRLGALRTAPKPDATQGVYGGDPRKASAELGQIGTDAQVEAAVQEIRREAQNQ